MKIPIIADMKESAIMIRFEELYDQAVKISHNLMEDIRSGRSVDVLSVKKCSELICAYLSSNTNILSLLIHVQDKNPYIYSHPVNVALISYAIGKWMKIKESDLSKLVIAGLLHDIGKAKIKDSILNKPDKLTKEEMETIKTHPTLGYKILVGLDVLDKNVLMGVLYHHERQDGSGYPKGLKGEQIHLFARIVAIADIYDAVTSTKVYRSKSSPFKAVEEIQSGSFGSLDPMICQVFMKNLSNYYCGSHVRLSNEREGDIVYINQCEKTKPLIRCDNEFLNLSKERSVEIVEVIET